MEKINTIVWFRNDLRLNDNPALHFGVEQGAILPIFIVDTVNSAQPNLGEASRWWLHQSLNALNDQLEQQLLCFQGDPEQVLLDLCQQYQCNQVVWNRGYEPWQIARDTQIKQNLKQAGIAVNSFNGSLLWEPWDIKKDDGTPYRVFTPFYRKGCLNFTAPRLPLERVSNINFVNHTKRKEHQVAGLNLLPKIQWHKKFHRYWQPGKDLAERMSVFVRERVTDYKAKRDFPAVEGTSKLSAYLHFGELSPNQIWYAAVNQCDSQPDNKGLDCFLSELGWREFSYYLLYHFPTFPTENYQKKFDSFPWTHDTVKLTAWQTGQTGIPIVDAGMRELWETGHMHNRVRMIVASFLTKNLLIHWKEGAQWFWDCLVDADLAANSASWQWVAGTGADAAPYFRIFNPVTQGEKFDSDGAYVKTFCPELRGLPDKFVHKPWDAPQNVLEQAGIELGTTYPKPIVDLKASRQAALEHFSNLK